jgi:hypothetical protein
MMVSATFALVLCVTDREQKPENGAAWLIPPEGDSFAEVNRSYARSPERDRVGKCENQARCE